MAVGRTDMGDEWEFGPVSALSALSLGILTLTLRRCLLSHLRVWGTLHSHPEVRQGSRCAPQSQACSLKASPASVLLVSGLPGTLGAW